MLKAPKPLAKLNEMFCGCGRPEDAWDAVHQELKNRDAHWQKLRADRSFDGKEGWAKLSPETGRDYLFLYILDHVGLLEHGGSVGGSWLTDDGEESLAFLEKHADKEWWDWQSPDFVGDDRETTSADGSPGER